MAFPFRRILCPVDFDHSAAEVLDLAARIATTNDGTIYALHVVPMAVGPSGIPVDVDIYKEQAAAARTRLHEMAREHLSGVKYELMTHAGEPIGTIIRAEKQIPADVVVIATHGRCGFGHVFAGSVAEAVARQSICPVVTLHCAPADRHLVGYWMKMNPVTAHPDHTLARVQEHMREGKFRSMPVVKAGRLVGIVTDRDVRQRSGNLESVAVEAAMTREVLSVTPRTCVWDAARLLSERKIGGTPVLDEYGALVGIITTTDLLRAFSEMQAK